MNPSKQGNRRTLEYAEFKKEFGSVACAFLVLMFISSCGKETVEKPVSPTLNVITYSINSISDSAAICGGLIAYKGPKHIEERGVCWSTHQSPTVLGNRTIDGFGVGEFVSNVNGLLPNTHYFIQAYATVDNQTTYGTLVSFSTLASSP